MVIWDGRSERRSTVPLKLSWGMYHFYKTGATFSSTHSVTYVVLGVHSLVSGTLLEISIRFYANDDDYFISIYKASFQYQGEELKRQIGAVVYIECSSKTQQVCFTFIDVLTFMKKMQII
jgi:hypothetical protein